MLSFPVALSSVLKRKVLARRTSWPDGFAVQLIPKSQTNKATDMLVQRDGENYVGTYFADTHDMLAVDWEVLENDSRAIRGEVVRHVTDPMFKISADPILP